MASYRKLRDLIDEAERKGFYWDKHWEPLMVRGDMVIAKTHYRLVFNVSFLKTLLGTEPVETGTFDSDLNPIVLPAYHYHANVMFDMVMRQEGDIVDYLYVHAKHNPPAE